MEILFTPEIGKELIVFFIKSTFFIILFNLVTSKFLLRLLPNIASVFVYNNLVSNFMKKNEVKDDTGDTNGKEK